MRTRLSIVALLPLVCAGCFPTRIVTYSPQPSTTSYYSTTTSPYNTYYSTTVTPAKTHTTTTIAQVYSKSEDISLHLDLQAVAALFAQTSSVQEFEQLLNSSSYPVSNLDLNGDGYIDYLRVLETVDGYNHVFLIQAVLAQDVYQDVATLVAEYPSYNSYSVEIIGAPYIYGPNYIVRPVFIARPPMFDHFRRSAYEPWRSPWYWGHFPSHYKHPAPVYLNHYQAYVNTFMSNHRYCHEMSYPSKPHYENYDNMTRDLQRNDYGAKNPEKSFTVRNANTPKVTGSVAGGNYSQSGTVTNAYDIRQNSEASKVTTTTTSPSGRGTGSTSTTRTSSSGVSSTSGRSASTTSTTSSSRGTSTSSTTSRSSSTSSSSGTITNSRVRSSGSSSTSVRSNSGTSTTRSSSSGSVSSTSSRSSGTSSSGSTRSSSSSTRSGSSSSSSSSTQRGTRR